MSYETIVGLSQTWGLVYFILLFAGVCVYALRPRNRERFDNAANIPLNEED